MPGPASATIRMIDRRWPEKVDSDILLASQPNKRFTTVEELGALAVFLCGPGADTMTGALARQWPPGHLLHPALEAPDDIVPWEEVKREFGLYIGPKELKELQRVTLILAQQEHPGILRPLAWGLVEDRHYIVFPDFGRALSSFENLKSLRNGAPVFTNLVDAPIVAPKLMPETLNG